MSNAYYMNSEKPDEHTQKLLDAGKLRRNADGDYITCPPSEWKDGEDKEKALAELAKKEAEQKAIELLVSNGMMKRNAQGEYEFQRLPYKPAKIGVITPDSQ